MTTDHVIYYRDKDVESIAIAHACPASREVVVKVLDQPISDDTRSEFEWLRLANGDLMLGVWPRGDGYFSVEKDVEADFAYAERENPTYYCDYPHYDPNDNSEIDAPAEVWIQDHAGDWTPLCGACLPEFWCGGDQADGPWVVYPIKNIPSGPKRIRRGPNATGLSS